MNQISKEEVLKIATISNIILSEEEIAQVTQELSQVLLYAARVAQYPGDAPLLQAFDENITRKDILQPPLGIKLLDQTRSDENCFVVPLILE